ncbi:MAG: hypothetical protein AB7E96_04435 [Deferribacterales bacterium]
MTTTKQKNFELYYAEQTSIQLNENWMICGNLDEENLPDLTIKVSEEKFFGLEVRFAFIDEGERYQNASALKRNESETTKLINQLAEMYYERNEIPINVKIYGELSKDLIDEIVEKLVNHNISKPYDRVEVMWGKIKLYICRIPDVFAGYRRWMSLSDCCGWVRNIDTSYIQKIIDDKNKKYFKYSSNNHYNGDVRLLIVFNKVLNSGKANITDDLSKLNKYQFNKVYILLHTDKVIAI